MWLIILVAILLPFCFYSKTDYPSGSPTSSSPTGAPTDKPTFEPSLKPTSSSIYCLEFVLLDKFGDGWDTAHFYLFDSSNIYSKYAPTCINNRVYAEYCFDTISNKNGDYVTAMADGYKPDQPWEIFWQAFDVSTGAIYTGAYQTKMVFTFHKAGSSSYISLTSSDFIQRNTVDNCESCIFENKDGATQWWNNPTRAPTKRPTPLPSHQQSTSSPSISFNPSHSNQPVITNTDPPVSTPVTESNVGSSDNNINEPQFSNRNSFNHHKAVTLPLRNNRHRNLRIFYYHDEIEFGMSGHNGSTWFSNDNLGAVYTISNATGDILFYSGTMCSGQKYPSIKATSITNDNRKLIMSRKLPEKPSLKLPGSDTNHASSGDTNKEGTGAGSNNNQYSSESCDWGDLEPGYYRIRVSGSNYNYKSEVLWSLCGILGHAQEELLFQISDDENKEYRECVTYYLRNNTEFCGAGGVSGVSNYVTLQATIKLGGVSISELSTSQTNVIKTTLAQQFSDISATVIPVTEVKILSWESTSSTSDKDKFEKNRQLLTPSTTTSTSTTLPMSLITFTIRLPSHKSTTSNTLNEIKSIKTSTRYEENHLKPYLQSSMRNGLFLSHLKSHALNLNELEFQKIATAELLNIHMINETRRNANISDLLNMIFYGGTFIGLIFSILLVKWYYYNSKKKSTSYNLVPENSMHN